MADFQIKARYAARIRWSKRGSCGEAGCTDPECGCALCGLPVGVPDDDPRWYDHPEWCPDPECALCCDQVPIILFRGAGKETEQAQFHDACFRKIIWCRQGITAAVRPLS